MKRILLMSILGLLLGCEVSNSLETQPSVDEKAESQIVLPDVEEVNEYKLVYHLTHLGIVRELYYQVGESLTLLPITRDGYVFDGWYLDELLTEKIDRLTMSSEDVQLYPKWTVLPAFVVAPFNPSLDSYGIHQFRNLILPTDPSQLSGVVYVDLVMRYFGRNTTMQYIGTYMAYSYAVTFLNGYSIELMVEQTATKEEADFLAKEVAFQIGQIPEAIVSGLRTFTVFIGNEHGSSGTNTEHWIYDIDQIFREDHQEYILHHLVHASLDWSQMEPANNTTISIHDNQTIQRHVGRLNKVDWLAAGQADGFFISDYAAEHPAREDVAETTPAYLAVRMRPERFDPKLIEYLSANLANRFAMLDELNINFP